MAQESMPDIKRRMKSVGSTKQITKAMELVSISKLKKSRTQMELIQPYYNAVLSSIQEILTNSAGINHPMIDNREVKKKAFIVITADRGLCGGYNSNVIKKVVETLSDKDDSKFIVVGQKGINYFDRRDYDVVGRFTGISESPSFMDATQLSNIVLKLYAEEEVDEVNIVYTEFINTITYEPKIIKLLPGEEIETDNNEETSNNPEGLREYEPSPEVVLDYLIPKYVKAVIYGSLIESSASEHGARRFAMENATSNAEDMLSDLNLVYNRARQAAVTQEISEIVSGADALN